MSGDMSKEMHLLAEETHRERSKRKRKQGRRKRSNLACTGGQPFPYNFLLLPHRHVKLLSNQKKDKDFKGLFSGFINAFLEIFCGLTFVKVNLSVTEK